MIEKIDIYNERLLLFAKGLSTPRAEEPNNSAAWIVEGDQWHYVEFNMNCFLKLPKVFKEWSYYEPAEEVEIKSYPKYLGMVGMVMGFFGLTRKEFIQLFGDKNQSVKNIADNIRVFTDKRK